MAWFTENSSLYEEEISLLNQYGYKFEIDEVEKSKGNLVIFLDYEIDNNTFKLKCEYPPSFPFFAVKVSCQDFPSGRHLCPVSHGICLFYDEQSSWSPSDSLANVIHEQIPFIYNSHLSPTDFSENEAAEGYQVSGQLVYEQVSTIFAEEIDFADDDSFGGMTLSIAENTTIDTSIKGCISSISLGGEPKNISASPIENRYKKRLHARWVKLDEPLSKFTGKELIELVSKINPSLKTPSFNKFGKNGIDIVGIVFPEEQHERKKSLNWLFVIRRKKKLGTKKYLNNTSIIRSDYYTRDNLSIRTPRLVGIEDKRVLLVGVGALGSHVALQLARSGVKNLTVVDSDHLQAGNLPRWLPAFDFIGMPKTVAIANILARDYPFLRCEGINFKIGAGVDIPHQGKLLNSHDFLIELIKKSDLVIDCTAESNVSHYLSNLCSLLKKSFVWATATTGGWGGIVGKSSSTEDNGGWFEFSRKYSNGDILKPASEEGPMIQPTGCFSPTFTGSGFDLDQVSLMTTRVCISLMLEGKPNSYTGFDWGVAVLNLWDEESVSPIPSEWSTYKI